MDNREEIKDNENQNENQIPGTQEELPEIDPLDKKDKDVAFEEKIAELNDKYLRLYSEFDNYRKRTAKEKLDLAKTAGEDIVKSLLPVVDDFERAMKSIKDESSPDTIREGISLIYNKFKKTLAQKGLEDMKAVGELFDSEIHEALTNIDAPSEDLKGKVIDEVEKGYLLNGKVIRHAKVLVGK